MPNPRVTVRTDATGPAPDPRPGEIGAARRPNRLAQAGVAARVAVGVAVLAGLTAGLMMAGCAHGSRSVGRGEAAFTTATGLDHPGEPFVSPYAETVQPPIEPPADGATAESLMREGLSDVWDLVREPGGVAKLKRDGIWGSQLALQAMLQWRLGVAESARRAARRAIVEDASIGNRDLVLATAVPALVELSRLERSVGSLESPDRSTLDDLADRAGRTTAQLTAARERAGRAMVAAYLIEAELRSLTAMRAVMSRDDRYDATEVASAWETEVGERLGRLEDLIGETPDGRAVVERWAAATGVAAAGG